MLLKAFLLRLIGLPGIPGRLKTLDLALGLRPYSYEPHPDDPPLYGFLTLYPVIALLSLQRLRIRGHAYVSLRSRQIYYMAESWPQLRVLDFEPCAPSKDYAVTQKQEHYPVLADMDGLIYLASSCPHLEYVGLGFLPKYDKQYLRQQLPRLRAHPVPLQRLNVGRSPSGYGPTSIAVVLSALFPRLTEIEDRWDVLPLDEHELMHEAYLRNNDISDSEYQVPRAVNRAAMEMHDMWASVELLVPMYVERRKQRIADAMNPN
ncbi:hypothetical protein BD413DRAFT_161715 [Trametes elegans]|nr:hypothetical protein BD413DRAFT_161715 [Trametes elegans]